MRKLTETESSNIRSLQFVFEHLLNKPSYRELLLNGAVNSNAIIVTKDKPLSKLYPKYKGVQTVDISDVNFIEKVGIGTFNILLEAEVIEEIFNQCSIRFQEKNRQNADIMYMTTKLRDFMGQRLGMNIRN